MAAREINVRALREGLAQALTEVQSGRRLIVTQHRQKIAAVVPIKDLLLLQRAKESSPMSIHTLFNHAGGSAKTTTVRELSYQLSKMGFKVLAVDLDSQANLSEWLGFGDVPREHTVLPTMLDRKPLEVHPQYNAHGFDLIPANLNLVDIEDRLATPEIFQFRNALRDVAREHQYDFVFIDASPSGAKLSQQACIAADSIICPVMPTVKGHTSLVTLNSLIDRINPLNPGLKVSMYLLTNLNPTSTMNVHFQGELRARIEELGVPLFSEGIRRRETVYEAASYMMQPVTSLERKTKIHGLKEAQEELQQMAEFVLGQLQVGAEQGVTL
ncbi:ParA family protein [Deinococcus cellulosilyticus]|uniref:AAA domain-containing protein n=1 Tax=Deinococcus cellulosilyticus (strain DSM 18568 / NBRC 106333 / KACC 11606 / 5516J-15) TaxID=1223518 RepID=A0A511NBG1_DEIC1|nr:ParA family protein [Deinococcus cellulosilyticus]GEM50134.1 hypothetical protein DC3_57690 [Deinococcus cellulosilyticus NBRC 106333 = KACC 11606]